MDDVKSDEKKKNDFKGLITPLIFALLFWIPLVNVAIFLPVSLFYSSRYIKKYRKNLSLSLVLGIALFVWAFVSFVIGLVIFAISSDNVSFTILWSIISVICLALAIVYGFFIEKKQKANKF